MTPTEKAKELFDKFSDIVDDIGRSDWGNPNEAKKCAIIAVDEIIGQAEYNRCYDFDKEYYEQVKQEIKKI